MKIGREERDALWEQLISDLLRGDDLALVISKGDAKAARRLRKRHSQHVRLLNLIGWQRAQHAESFELPVESDLELVAALRRLGEEATATLAGALLEVDLGALERLCRIAQVCVAATGGHSV